MKYNANATQAEAIKFLLSHKKSILCLEPGSGKKSIILSVLNELKYDYFENRRVLLISKNPIYTFDGYLRFRNGII